MTDTYKAYLDSFDFAKQEETMVKGVGLILDVILDSSEVLPQKEVHSILVRMENTLKAMSQAFRNADILLDPDKIDQLCDNIADYRRTLE